MQEQEQEQPVLKKLKIKEYKELWEIAQDFAPLLQNYTHLSFIHDLDESTEDCRIRYIQYTNSLYLEKWESTSFKPEQTRIAQDSECTKHFSTSTMKKMYLWGEYTYNEITKHVAVHLREGSCMLSIRDPFNDKARSGEHKVLAMLVRDSEYVTFGIFTEDSSEIELHCTDADINTCIEEEKAFQLSTANNEFFVLADFLKEIFNEVVMPAFIEEYK